MQARLDAAERDALSAQQSLQAFRAENGIADFETEDEFRPGAAGRSPGAQTGGGSGMRPRPAPWRVRLKTGWRISRKRLSFMSRTPVTGRLLDLQVRQADLLARYQPDAPPVQAVEREIEALERFVREGRANGQGQRRTGVNPIWQELESSRLQQESNAAGQARLAASLAAQAQCRSRGCGALAGASARV